MIFLRFVCTVSWSFAEVSRGPGRNLREEEGDKTTIAHWQSLVCARRRPAAVLFDNFHQPKPSLEQRRKGVGRHEWYIMLQWVAGDAKETRKE